MQTINAFIQRQFFVLLISCILPWSGFSQSPSSDIEVVTQLKKEIKLLSGKKHFELLIAEFDTINDLIEKKQLEENDIAYFQKQYTKGAEWAKKYGAFKEQVMVDYCNFQLLTSTNGELYDRIVAGNSVWFNRKELSLQWQKKLCNSLIALYNVTGRAREELEVVTYKNELAQKNNELIKKDELYAQYASLYLGMLQYDNAKKYYFLAEQEYKRNKNVLYQSSIQNNLGQVYFVTGNLDSARIMYSKAISNLESEISSQDPPDSYYVHFLNVVKWNLYNLSRDEFTEELFAISMSLIQSGQETGEIFWAYNAYSDVALYHFSKKDFPTALTYIDSACVLGESARKSGIPVDPTALNIKVNILSALGEVKQSSTLDRHAALIADSIKRASESFDATVADAFYKSREKEFELKDNEVKIARYRNEINATQGRNRLLIVGIMTISLLIFILYYFLRKGNRDKKKILEKNDVIEKSLVEKEILLKEIHHRVKNNLQLVCSLLEIQSKNIKEQQLIDIFEEGQNRVQAMSLIHQHLYDGDNIGAIHFEDYLKQLFGYFESINASEAGVEITIEANQIEFDIDTAIPLSLIVNELVTNAFKYAFKDNATPKMLIRITYLSEGNYRLVVSDNGPGLKEDFDWKQSKTMGMRLVRGLTKQLLGSVEYQKNNDMSGFTIEFKDQFGRDQVD